MEQHVVHRRRLIWALSFLPLLICASDSMAHRVQAARSRDSITTITVWWPAWGGPADDALKNATAAAYKKINPNVRVNWLFLPNYLSTQDKLLPAIVGNHAPDATYTQGETVLGYALKNAFLPLDSFAQSSHTDLKGFSPALLSAYQWGGHLWGLPVAADYPTLIYNEDLFRAAGITHPPATIPEFDADNAKLIKYDSAGNIKQAGYFPQNPVTDEPPLLAGLPTWGFLFGGKFYNTSTHKFELNSPGNVRALQWMVGYAKKYNQTKIDRFTAALSVGADSITDPFYQGKMAMDFTGAWQAVFLPAAVPKMHVGVFPLPAAPGVEGHPWWFIGTWGFAIPRNSKHPKEAWDFFNWLATSASSGKVIADTQNNPAYMPALDSWYNEMVKLAGPHNTLLPGLALWKNVIIPNSKLSYYQTPISSFVDDQLNRAVQAAVHGQKSPQQALADANAACQAQLDSVVHS